MFGSKKKQERKLFSNTELTGAVLKTNPSYDLVKLYEQACSELALQQEKRDYLLKSYVLLISIVIPLLISIGDKVRPVQMGVMMLSIGLIGFIYSLIIIRYRVYKESYWITCRVISQLLNFEETSLNKKNIQALYYECLSKKWGRYVRVCKGGKKRIMHWRVFAKNIFSAESLLYLVMAFFTSVISGIGLNVAIGNNCLWLALLPIFLGLLIFISLLSMYFNNLSKVFKVLVDGTEDSFNYSFGKAWFLHFYRDQV